MSAAEALKAARALGVELSVDGGDLLLEASAPPPPDILDLLLRQKPGVLALLRAGPDGLSAWDWRVFFDARAEVAELNGSPTPEAEACAFACCVLEWLNRNFVHSSSDSCLGCDGAGHAHNPLLPFGTGAHGRAWLHSHCWDAWHAGRKATAVAALAAMGIEVRRTIHDQ